MVLGELVHCVAAYAQHRACLLGVEYRVGRCGLAALIWTVPWGRERQDSGEISGEECLDWKRGFSGA